jgi:hypothetical protein
MEIQRGTGEAAVAGHGAEHLQAASVHLIIL